MVRENFGPDAFACRNFKRDSGGEWTNISLRVKEKTRTYISRSIIFRKINQLQPPNRLHIIEKIRRKSICQKKKAKKAKTKNKKKIALRIRIGILFVIE